MKAPLQRVASRLVQIGKDALVQMLQGFEISFRRFQTEQMKRSASRILRYCMRWINFARFALTILTRATEFSRPEVELQHGYQSIVSIMWQAKESMELLSLKLLI